MNRRRRHIMHVFSSVLAGLFLAGCAALPDGGEPRSFVRTYGVDRVRPDGFVYCSGASCASLEKASLTRDEWSYVRAAFTPAAASAAEERRQIATAVARYEAVAGPKTGTANDKGGNIDGFLDTLVGSNQVDCISETVNTTTLILMLNDAGVLHWHTPWRPANRFKVGGWFHSTAVVREKATGADYAIDSWFFDNGHPAAVVTLKDWQAGWVPE